MLNDVDLPVGEKAVLRNLSASSSYLIHQVEEEMILPWHVFNQNNRNEYK